ncbi:MAG: peptidylprolyl isomerase [Flavobacteriales bacterium]|nr:peptidylprolyl isomerase [Flavobacteriales bacterium]
MSNQGIDFGKAAADNSDDEESRAQNGLMIEPNSNSARWPIRDLDQQVFFVLDKLKPGEVSEPQVVVQPDGTKAYRLLKLLSRTDPHRANLKDDYRLLMQAAEGRMRSELIDKWINEHIASTFVRIDPVHRACPFKYPWNKENSGQ